MYSYILVRKDLPQSVQVVQASHAAMEVGFRCETPSSPAHFVVIGVENQDELMYYYNLLFEKQKGRVLLFSEPDNDLGNTALCTYPTEGKIKCLNNLKLL